MKKTNKSKQVAQMFKAMGLPVRIAIIELLAESDQLSVTEIFTTIKIKQTIASHHLNILKRRGILSSKRVGKNTFYSVTHPGIMKAIKGIQESVKVIIEE